MPSLRLSRFRLYFAGRIGLASTCADLLFPV